MTLKGVLFDFNGTLFFDNAMHIEAFRLVFAKYGLPVPTDDFLIRRCFGRTNATIYRENIKADATPLETEAFGKQKEDLYRKFCLTHPEMFRLAEGAEEMLNALKKANVPFCLATGSDWSNVSFYIEHLGLDRWFSTENMVWDDGKYPGKPAPEIYRLGAAKLGLSPAECLVYEDGTSGILAANRAGAGAVIAVYEETYASPLNEETRVNAVYHDHRNWSKILAEYGLLK